MCTCAFAGGSVYMSAEARRELRVSGIELQAAVNCLHRIWEPNWGPLQQQQVLLNTLYKNGVQVVD